MNLPFVLLLLHLHVLPVTDLLPEIVAYAQKHCSVLEGAIRGIEEFTCSTDLQIGEAGPYAAWLRKQQISPRKTILQSLR